jgi:hypothetical protein
MAKLKLNDGTTTIVSDKRETDNRIGYGQTAGWDYAPGRMTQLDLFGTPTYPGAYRRMRDYHPTIKAILDHRRDAIASTKFEFQGRFAQPVNDYIKNSTFDGNPLNLSTLIAHITDQESSYGFCLLEVAYEPTGMHIWPTDPVTVNNFGCNDPQATLPSTVTFWNTMQGMEMYPFSRFALFSKSSWPGNWWGISDLSGLLTEYIIWENDTKLYLGQRMLEKGVVIASQKGNDGNVETRDTIEQALLSMLKGQDIYVLDDGNWDYQVLQVNSGQDAVKQRIELNASLDEKIRQALNANLNTLGLSSVGSKALGETIKTSDEEKFAAFIERSLNRFLASQLVASICKILAIPQEELDLGTVGSKYTSDRVQVDVIMTLITSGMITLDQLGATNRTLFIEALGLDPTSMTWAQPLPTDLAANAPQGPTTYPVPPTLRRTVAVGLERYMATPVADRTMLTAREINLVRKITSGDPLTLAQVIQWDAIRADLDSQSHPIRKEIFGTDEANMWVSQTLNV